MKIFQVALVLSLIPVYFGNCDEDSIRRYEESAGRYFVSKTVYNSARMLQNLCVDRLEAVEGSVSVRCTFQIGNLDPVSISIMFFTEGVVTKLFEKTDEKIVSRERYIGKDSDYFNLVKELRNLVDDGEFWIPLSAFEEQYFLSNSGGSVFLFERASNSPNKVEALAIFNPESPMHRKLPNKVRSCEKYQKFAKIITEIWNIEYNPRESDADSEVIDPFSK